MVPSASFLALIVAIWKVVRVSFEVVPRTAATDSQNARKRLKPRYKHVEQNGPEHPLQPFRIKPCAVSAVFRCADDGLDVAINQSPGPPRPSRFIILPCSNF